MPIIGIPSARGKHLLCAQVLHSHPGPYLAMRKQLVTLTLHCAAALQLSQETAHTALALMDRCVMGGMQLSDQLHTLMVCACLRVAALQESSFLPSPLAIQALTNLPRECPSISSVILCAAARHSSDGGCYGGLCPASWRFVSGAACMRR